MKKTISDQIAKFVLFSFPCYGILALVFIALVVWGVPLNNPDVISFAAVSAVILIAGVFLIMNHHWISIPMILLGAYIFCVGKDDQHFGLIFQVYGAYLILHFLFCFVYVIKKRKKE